MRIEEVVYYARPMQREERSQVVYIPAYLQGRSSSYNRITRTSLVKGSWTVRSLYLPLSPKPAEFGIVTYNERRYAVVHMQGDDYWEVVEKEPERLYQRTQADLLGGGNT
jgi:hypothetical protein